MFEDFRKQTEDASFPDDKQDQEQPPSDQGKDRELLLGMTPPQRFIIALLILVMAIILGLLFLMVTSKVVLPVIG